MIHRLIAPAVKPAMCYGYEIWGALCVGNMVPELRRMAEAQLAVYRQTLRDKKTATGHLILAGLSEVAWVGSWWSQILGFLSQVGQPGR